MTYGNFGSAIMLHMLRIITVYFQWLSVTSGSSVRHDCNMLGMNRRL
jgi:hypothetical protein